MAVADEEMLYKIIIYKLSTYRALSTPLLSPVLIDRDPLCKTLVRYGDDNLFFLDEVFRGSILKLPFVDFSPSSVAISLTDLDKLVFYNAKDLMLISKKLLIIFDLDLKICKFLQYLLCLKMGKPSKPHVYDGISLYLGEVEPLLKLKRCNVIVLTFLYDPYNLINVIESDFKAFKDMCPLFSFL